MMPYVVRFAFVIFFSVSSSPSGACILPAQIAEMRGDLLLSINEVRQSYGLSILQPDSRIEAAAQAHACENSAIGRISHSSADGRQIQDRLKQAGYAWNRVAENIAAGQPDVAAVLSDWMKSRPHRRNLLIPDLTTAGIGIALSPDGKIVWVINMASLQ